MTNFQKKVYHSYLDALDPNHLYFLQSDIEKFNKDKDKFDDYIKEGNAQPAFDMYNLFLQRVNERLQFVYGFMQKSLTTAPKHITKPIAKSCPLQPIPASWIKSGRTS